MFRTLFAGAVAVSATLALAAPAAAAPAVTDAGLSRVASGTGTSSAPQSTPLRAGELNYQLDGFACTDTGGALGHGFIGSRGYMEEVGGTGVTKMTINILTQQKYVVQPYWRTVSGSSRTWSYSFGGADSASHFLRAPASDFWAYHYSAANDSSNHIFRQKLKFTWSNAVSKVSRTITTGACFSD